jgi:UDP-N-acetylglucosamine 3-dehydrogenase
VSEPRLRLAVLGCGQAAVLAARALRGLRGVSCAYASRQPERAARFAQKLGGRAFASYEEALASADVDAVLVATPPASHFELALRALDCGKSVVLEKPPTLRTGELDALATAARLVGRRVMVAENYFYKPLARALRELIGDGAVGELLFVHVNALKAQRTEGWRGDPRLAGGGALFEGGIHWVDLLANLGPRVERVEGFLTGVNGKGSVDRSVLAVFRYSTGAVGTLSYSWETASALRGLRLSRVYGREGSIAFESNGLFLATWGRVKRLAFPGLRDISGRRAMWADFVPALQENREPQYDMRHARRDLELVEAIYASAARGGGRRA